MFAVCISQYLIIPRIIKMDTLLKVMLSVGYNRKPLPASHEAAIDEIWNSRLQGNPTLWNGSKFRIASVTDGSDGVTFNLGITSYKDFIGTNWSPNAKTLRRLGDQDYANSQVCVVIVRRVRMMSNKAPNIQ